MESLATKRIIALQDSDREVLLRLIATKGFMTANQIKTHISLKDETLNNHIATLKNAKLIDNNTVTVDRKEIRTFHINNDGMGFLIKLGFKSTNQ